MNTNIGDETCADVDSAGFFTVQPLRDPESNWSLDLANKLEEYLLKICSGEITNEDGTNLSVNFAEAALLLQGSVQVYGRKVEYLYSLVLHALETVSNPSTQDQEEGTSNQSEERGPKAALEEGNDTFWCLDDVPVEENNSLDSCSLRDAHLKHSLKPPPNLVVLEGDCLNNPGDGGELESYLLATSCVYRDFILLDPCDAASVDVFLSEDNCGKEILSSQKNKTMSANSRKNFFTPPRRSGGSAHKPSLRKQTPLVDHTFHDIDGLDPPKPCDFSGNDFGFNENDGYFGPVADSDDATVDDGDDDPLKPLNPHEPGNLKVRPLKENKRQGINFLKNPRSKKCPDFIETWMSQCCISDGDNVSKSPSFYEKLRQLIVNETRETCDAFDDLDIDNENTGFDGGCSDDFEQTDGNFSQNWHVDEDAHFPNDTHNTDFDEPHNEQDVANTSLEDLCRSHLDALLANIAESEKQNELAARVSSWKQNIEHNLEEQELHSPFDIHEYGGRIMDKLAMNTYGTNSLSFSDIVRGSEKHDVARSFSALLQLVNNGNVDLIKNKADGESVCYTAENPFHVRLLSNDNRILPSKKRAKTQTANLFQHANKPSLLESSKKRARTSTPNPNLIRASTSGSVQTMSSRPSRRCSMRATDRCSPESGTRRASRFPQVFDFHSAAERQ